MQSWHQEPSSTLTNRRRKREVLQALSGYSYDDNNTEAIVQNKKSRMMSSDDINNFYQVPPPQQRENLTYIDAEGGEKNNKMMMLKIHHRIANDHRTIYEYDNSHLLEADDYESENANDSSNNTNHYNLSDSALDSPDSIGIDTSMISCSTRSMDTIDNMHNASIEESPSLQHDMRSRKPLILSDYNSFQRQ